MNKFYFNLRFLGIILVLTLVILTGTPAFAQEPATPTPTPTIVMYDLAFPGLLPDNPLYKLKTLREKISAIMISDPFKKIDFYLLQADKGILASAMLVDKKEIELAKITALKAENNMTLLTYQFGQLPKKPDPSVFDKLKKASLKHQEVLESLKKRVSASDAKTFDSVINFSKTNLQTIEDFENNGFQK